MRVYRNKYKARVETRSDLLTLLSEASEIEHSLACSYLYTAFSLKDKADENLLWEQLHLVKKWAGQLYFVAAEEMLHLAQVWNLTSAIGGIPYYSRPNFPVHVKYYHFDLPITLKPFTEEAIKLFKMYELPRNLSEEEYIRNTFPVSFEDGYSYKTVGELYQMIYEGIECIPEKELFIADPKLQVGTDLIDFPDIIKVHNRASALQAVKLIIEQGEGTLADEKNSHFYIFSQIQEELQKEILNDKNFKPARNIITNPVVYNKSYPIPPDANLLSNPVAIEVSDYFDDLYLLMIQALQYVFISDNKHKAAPFAKFAIHLMPSVLKPLGEILNLIPAGDEYKGLYSGPSFTMNRHISYPQNPEVTKQVFDERLFSLRERGEQLLSKYKLPEEFKSIFMNLTKISPAYQTV